MPLGQCLPFIRSTVGAADIIRVEAGPLEAGRVEAGARDSPKVAKVALLTRARAGCPVGIFACARDEQSARGAGRIEAGIMTA